MGEYTTSGDKGGIALTFGQIHEFSPENEIIGAYLERVEVYFQANGVAAVGETIAEYEAELRRLATHCEFDAHPSQALRDRLVCRLRNEATQKHLLSKSDLTLEWFIEIT